MSNLFSDIDKEEFNKEVTNYFKKIAETRIEGLRYLILNYDALKDKIIKDLEVENYIDGDTIMYNPEKYNLTLEEFQIFVNEANLFLANEGHYEVDEESMFENHTYYLNIGENIISFFTMYGQGTHTNIKLEEDEPYTIVADYKDFIGYVNSELIRVEKDLIEI